MSDNGSGVKPEDYHALTLKYHTSKLQQFNDLTVRGPGAVGWAWSRGGHRGTGAEGHRGRPWQRTAQRSPQGVLVGSAQQCATHKGGPAKPEGL